MSTERKYDGHTCIEEQGFLPPCVFEPRAGLKASLNWRKVSRKSIYQWRERYRLGGSNALRGRGRMTKAEHAAHGETLTTEKQAKAIRQASLEELARAQRRIAALERKIGQQQVELDFFQQALGQVREQRLRAACLAGQRLGSHPSDDGVTVAMRDRNRTHVPARQHKPVRLLSTLAAIGAPQEQAGLRDAIQRLALEHRHYGYRRIGALLRRMAGKPITSRGCA
jgi:hypothetical protein